MDTSTYKQYWQMGQSVGLKIAGCVGRQLRTQQDIVMTAMKPDMVLYSECERTVYYIDLMIPFEDAIEEAFEWKKLKYMELVTEAREQGWKALTRPVEIGAL